MDRTQIVGAWTLKSFFIDRADGSRVFPYGEDARGTLVYADSGWVSAVLSRQDRGPFRSESLERARVAPDDDKLRAFDGYTSYAARYRVVGDAVEHTVEMSLVPTLVGQTLRRNASFEGETLVLRYDVPSRSGNSAYELRWERT